MGSDPNCTIQGEARQSTLPIEGFCAIGVIGANLRQVFLPLALAGAYRATVEQDQTLIEQMTPISQKLRARREPLARGGAH